MNRLNQTKSSFPKTIHPIALSVGRINAVTKLSPVPTPLKHWLEGDLLLLGKGAVWTDILTTLLQVSTSGRRGTASSNPTSLHLTALNLLAPLTLILGIVILWQWDGMLLGALLLGGGSAALLYQALVLRSIPWQRIRQGLRHPHAPLWLSVGSGLGMLLMSYGALTVWQQLHSPWLAMVLLIQEIGLLAVLALAIQLLLTQPQASLQSFERCVAGLLHRDELRRLMAVRQLGILITQNRLSSTERSHALDYLHLLAQREQSALVQTAIQDGLALLSPTPRSLAGSDRPSLSVRRTQPLGMGQAMMSVKVR